MSTRTQIAVLLFAMSIQSPAQEPKRFEQKPQHFEGVSPSITLDEPTLRTPGPTMLVMVLDNGKGKIVIHFDSGKVDLPENLPVDRASREFWLCLAKYFPGARETIIRGEGGPK